MTNELFPKISLQTSSFKMIIEKFSRQKVEEEFDKKGAIAKISEVDDIEEQYFCRTKLIKFALDMLKKNAGDDDNDDDELIKLTK